MIRLLLIAVSALALLSGCGAKTSDINVAAQTNPKTNLEGYQTYSWLVKESIVVDTKKRYKNRGFNVSEYMQAQITKELVNMDRVETEGEPDFLISYVLGVNMDTLKDKVDDNGKKYLENIPEAGAAIVMIDPVSKRVIWIASAQAQMDATLSDEEAKERIAYAVEEMFEEFE